MSHRLYSFVANHYLSPLQCGLQTAHVVSEMFNDYAEGVGGKGDYILTNWAALDKTIIICGAGNHKGVRDCYIALNELASELGLPYTLFEEDLDSMNGMATACGVIVPQKYWDVTYYPTRPFVEGRFSLELAYYEYVDSDEQITKYEEGTPQFNFIQHIKSFRLA